MKKLIGEANPESEPTYIESLIKKHIGEATPEAEPTCIDCHINACWGGHS